ncbi:hypothetical protein DBR47_01685 [Paucibacter sp. KBW04]|nr:hypothetical protein DBR47_01685 [Paucibacter sp. KBW04]
MKALGRESAGLFYWLFIGEALVLGPLLSDSWAAWLTGIWRPPRGARPGIRGVAVACQAPKMGAIAFTHLE